MNTLLFCITCTILLIVLISKYVVQFCLSKHEPFYEKRQQNLWVIVSTSIISIYEPNIELRENQYINGISAVIKSFPDARIVIVENNGKRRTVLDRFASQNVTIYYTETNKLPNGGADKSWKERNDMLLVINNFQIPDDDFIVKVTGRYVIQDNSPFVTTVNNISPDIHAVLRFGSYREQGDNAPTPNINDTNTGLIGFRCYYWKLILNAMNSGSIIELQAAHTVNTMIPKKSVVSLPYLGIMIAPGMNDYYLV